MSKEELEVKALQLTGQAVKVNRLRNRIHEFRGLSDEASKAHMEFVIQAEILWKLAEEFDARYKELIDERSKQRN